MKFRLHYKHILQKVSLMNIHTKRRNALRIVCISCVADDDPHIDATASDWGSYHVANKTEDVCQQLSTGQYDCVVALFDPASQQSAKQLESVCTCAREYSVPVASLSTFNPSWILYLMRHFDIAQHFDTLPSEAQLRRLGVSSKEQRDAAATLQ